MDPTSYRDAHNSNASPDDSSPATGAGQWNPSSEESLRHGGTTSTNYNSNGYNSPGKRNRNTADFDTIEVLMSPMNRIAGSSPDRYSMDTPKSEINLFAESFLSPAFGDLYSPGTGLIHGAPSSRDWVPSGTFPQITEDISFDAVVHSPPPRLRHKVTTSNNNGINNSNGSNSNSGGHMEGIAMMNGHASGASGDSVRHFEMNKMALADRLREPTNPAIPVANAADDINNLGSGSKGKPRRRKSGNVAEDRDAALSADSISPPGMSQLLDGPTPATMAKTALMSFGYDTSDGNVGAGGGISSSSSSNTAAAAAGSGAKARKGKKALLDAANNTPGMPLPNTSESTSGLDRALSPLLSASVTYGSPGSSSHHLKTTGSPNGVGVPVRTNNNSNNNNNATSPEGKLSTAGSQGAQSRSSEKSYYAYIKEKQAIVEQVLIESPGEDVNRDLFDVNKAAIRCFCKKSRCLKLYCDCFRFEKSCNGCHCFDCLNTDATDGERQVAITAILERNPEAFKCRVTNVDVSSKVKGHMSGCHCKKSGCLKKYCECYQLSVPCSEKCRCQDCKNTMGSPAYIGSGIVALPLSAMLAMSSSSSSSLMATVAPMQPPTSSLAIGGGTSLLMMHGGDPLMTLHTSGGSSNNLANSSQKYHYASNNSGHYDESSSASRLTTQSTLESRRSMDTTGEPLMVLHHHSAVSGAATSAAASSSAYDDHPSAFEIIDNIEDENSLAAGTTSDVGLDDGGAARSRAHPSRLGQGTMSPRRLLLDQAGGSSSASLLDHTKSPQVLISGSNGVTIPSPSILKGKRVTAAAAAQSISSSNNSHHNSISYHSNSSNNNHNHDHSSMAGGGSPLRERAIVIEVKSPNSRGIHSEAAVKEIANTPIASLLDFAGLCEQREAEEGLLLLSPSKGTQS